jgi:glycerol-3-phosphate dehydrogenase subunit B
VGLIQHDVIIIGAGVAGLTAGSILVEKGYNVALIAKGEPTACLSTGCIDICSLDHDPLHGVSHLPDEHPYHLVSRAVILESIEKFKESMAQMGFPYTGSPESNRYVLSALGTFKTTCLVPSTMAAAPQDEKDDLHIITFSGLKDFYPSYITARRKNASFSTYDASASTTMGLATNFEREDFLEKFLSWLEKLNIQEGKIAFPAVLGLESAATITQKIEERLRCKVFEIPTIPPSMPGRRLFNALKDYFRKKGGMIYWSWPVSGVEKTKKIIEAVTTPSEGRPKSLNAKVFILASGSFVGGGLTARRDTIVENIFNLPVFVPGQRDNWFDSDYFSLNHGIGKAGIIVDSSFRPKEADWENIFVCGGILAHTDVLKNGCGHGMALATGHAAAASCMGYIK